MILSLVLFLNFFNVSVLLNFYISNQLSTNYHLHQISLTIRVYEVFLCGDFLSTILNECRYLTELAANYHS